MADIDTTTGSAPAEEHTEAPGGSAPPADAGGASAEKPRRKGGGNRKRDELRKLRREIRQLKAKVEDDPFAEPARGDAPPADKPPDAPGAAPDGTPAPQVKRLGEERAKGLFLTLCQLYDGLAPDLVLQVVMGRLERLNPDDARAIWAQIPGIVKLSESDQATLAPAIVSRLAELEVSDDFDLWFALAVVFGSKAILVLQLTDPEKGAAIAKMMASLDTPAKKPDVTTTAEAA